MEPSEHPQGRDPTASASPEQGPGNEVVASPVATGCADIGELLPALLGAVGEGLLVLGATESPPIWHNPQALPALRLLEPPITATMTGTGGATSRPAVWAGRMATIR